MVFDPRASGTLEAMPKVEPAPAVRVRFRRKEPELNVADLRASGDPDLVRLAEADKSASSPVVAKGNGDGWLSPKEVDAAVGIHLSVKGGYQALIAEAARRQATEIPASDVAALMLAGRNGPVKKRIPPRPRAAAPNPIMHATAYDAAKASPRFLRDIEQRLERTISEVPGHRPVYRGFTLHDYGGPEMVRYLMGDWRCLIASHTFCQQLAKELEGGDELHVALRRTAEQVSSQIGEQIGTDGYVAWAGAQSVATQIALRNKAATGMAAFPYPQGPLDGAMTTPTSFGYARTSFLGMVRNRVLEATHPMLMIEVDQQFPPGAYALSEYYIPSHVPPERVRSFFLGFSTWHDAHLYELPPQRREQWYHFAILARDDEGRPTEMKITPVKEKPSGFMESWSEDGPGLLASATGTSEGRAFRERHPLLGPSLDALAQLFP